MNELETKQLEKEIEIYRTCVLESLVNHRIKRDDARDIMCRFYKHIMQMDFPGSEFHCFDSPFQAWKWIQLNKCKNPNEQYVESYAVDIRNAGYYHFYDFALSKGFCKSDDKALLEKLKMALDCLHFSKVFPFDDCCVVAFNPIELHYNKDNQLHNENGKSCLFADGTGLYNLNGIPVPEYVVTTKPDAFTKKQILSEKNADVRREILRKIGNERMFKIFDATILDSRDDYKLISIQIENVDRKYLEMKNPSVDLVHVEGVPNTVSSVDEALAWRNGLDNYIPPVKLT
jgi:hypothetical protein